MSIIADIKNYIKNLVFPVTCVCCHEFTDHEGLCNRCWSKIKWISHPHCDVCGTPLQLGVQLCEECRQQRNKYFFDKAVSVFLYDDFSKRMILRMKDEDETYLAPILSIWLFRIIQDFVNDIDYIIPVPTDFFRRMSRKYNPPELLARELSQLANIVYEPRFLKKKTTFVRQKQLTRRERLKNLSESFAIDEKFDAFLQDKRILLIDDVITTGATANECSKILKKHGAAKVYVATVAKVILGKKHSD